jgi:hypothetical protein
MGTKAVDDVRRGSGQWRMAVRPRACAWRPRVTGLGVGGSSCSQAHSARGGSPRTGGHWPAPACVPGGTAAGHAHGATSCAMARVCKISSTYPFSIRIFSRFQNESDPNFEYRSCPTSYHLQKCQRVWGVFLTGLGRNGSTRWPKTRRQ